MSPQTDTPDASRATAAARVLVVDDERSMRELLSIVLRRDGYEVVAAADGRAALDVLTRERVDVLITDIRMPEMTGVDVLREAKRIDPAIISIIMTAFASTDTAVDALRLGAADYVHKSPNAVNDLRLRVRKELERRQLQQENVLLKRALGTPHAFANIIGGSRAMMAVYELIEAIAPTTSTVLISGESGTGKELVARAIHARSSRSDRPFVAVNCGALPDTLLDSELFGHMRGAFTGAETNKKGLLEVAETGHDLPRRDRRDEPARPGQAAPGAAGAPVPPARRHRRGRGGHPRDRGDQPRPVEDGGRGHVPGGPLLPHQRDSGEAAPAP
jgi:two-component system, NtrC family, response regulator PilR